MTAVEYDRASQHWETLVSCKEVYEETACTIRQAVLDSKNKREGRLAIREAILSTLQHLSYLSSQEPEADDSGVHTEWKMINVEHTRDVCLSTFSLQPEQNGGNNYAKNYCTVAWVTFDLFGCCRRWARDFGGEAGGWIRDYSCY